MPFPKLAQVASVTAPKASSQERCNCQNDKEDIQMNHDKYIDENIDEY